MLGYTFVIFILAPFMIITGVGMSPAVRGRFPRFVKMMGGPQGASSLHFIGMVLMAGFIVGQVTMVLLVTRARHVRTAERSGGQECVSKCRCRYASTTKK